MKDRFIGEIVRSIFNLMEFSLKENISGLMTLIDFHKAFDSLEWNFLFGCLKAFGFGPEFIWLVRTLYHNIETFVINNGLATDFFLRKGAGGKVMRLLHICSWVQLKLLLWQFVKTQR